MTRDEQFEYDLARVMVSLALRPRNWRCFYPHCLQNQSEDMIVWIDGSVIDTRFSVEMRMWGRASLFGLFELWRWNLKRRAKVTRDCEYVEKYGGAWKNLQREKWERQKGAQPDAKI
jgi:hypothetical protein